VNCTNSTIIGHVARRAMIRNPSCLISRIQPTLGRRLFGRAGKAGLDEDSRAGWNTLTQHGRLFNGRSVRVES
jgi:hypothetical protein